MSKYDYLIVGAGLFGSTFSRLATDKGKKCLVIDKRNHVGGNLYCSNIEGINVHKYGAHIFHTSNKSVWDFVNTFVPFNRYTNAPIAVAPDGNVYNLPFNMNTFYKLWGCTTPKEAALILDKQRNLAKIELLESGLTEPVNLEQQAKLLIGEDIYKLLIKEYTEKQWGRPCSELPPFIIKRLPVRMSFDNNYFNDLYQGIPIGGYNKLINGLLEGADIKLKTDFFNNRELYSTIASKIVFSGKIDEYFNYCYGKLEYRTVNFKTTIENVPNYQGNAVVNYTSAKVPYTRCIEHKHFETFGKNVYDMPLTIISREYSSEWKDGSEPFYPVNDSKNEILYKKYKLLADKQPNVFFGGRLGEYKYYDMAPIIESVFKIFENENF